MKKKKAAAAKMQRSYKDAYAERRACRNVAKMAARYIQSAWECLERAINAAEDSDEERRAMEDVKDSWFMAGNLMNFGNPAMMRLVTNELDGKQEHCRGGDHYDEMIKAAYEKVREARYPSGFNICAPFAVFANFKKAFAHEWKRRGLPERLMPTNYSLRRSLQRLGLPASDDRRGRPPGKK
jgi:hypothetical protein